MKNLTKTAFGGLLFLLSFNGFCAADSLNVKYINVPAYNLISDALNNMNAVNGKQNDFIMKQICDLARGDSTQNDVNSFLAKNSIKANELPAKGALSALLVNGNQPVQAYVCATYLASMLSQPVDNTTFLEEKKDKKGKATTVLNAEKFASEMRMKMSLTQATAQLYAVIASNLPTDSNSSREDYLKSVVSTVYNYAPEYLNLVKEAYKSEVAEYNPVTVSKNSLYVEDTLGKELQITSAGVVLKKNGVTWIGNGKILGKEYFSTLNVIPVKKDKPQAELPVVNSGVKELKKDKSN